MQEINFLPYIVFSFIPLLSNLTKLIEIYPQFKQETKQKQTKKIYSRNWMAIR
jgi:hypothetical protein